MCWSSLFHNRLLCGHGRIDITENSTNFYSSKAIAGSRVCGAVQLHSHMLCGRGCMWEQASEQRKKWIFQRSLGVYVCVSFMEETTTKVAALQIHFTLFAWDKELNIAAAEPFHLPRHCGWSTMVRGDARIITDSTLQLVPNTVAQSNERSMLMTQIHLFFQV